MSVFAFAIRVHDVKKLHDQLGLILHTGALVNMAEVCLHRVVPYLQPACYHITILTVKKQFEYLHLPPGESIAFLHVIPLGFGYIHDDIMIALATVVTLFNEDFVYRGPRLLPVSRSCPSSGHSTRSRSGISGFIKQPEAMIHLLLFIVVIRLRA